MQRRLYANASFLKDDQKARRFILSYKERASKPGRTYKPRISDADRERYNAAQRRYRREHPEKVAEWRENRRRKLALIAGGAENGGC